MKIQVFDPPMCCSTGVCGPSVDPEVVQFAADIAWLGEHGVEVERYNLSQEPGAFVDTPVVKDALAKEGDDCLPLIVIDGAIVCKGSHPTREALAGWAGLEQSPSIELSIAAGLDARRFAGEFGRPPRGFWEEAIAGLIARGWLEERLGGDLRLTRRGLLLSDSVFEYFV